MPMVGFPLLLIPVALYNMIIFLMPGVPIGEPLLKLTLMSGAEWSLTLSDMLLALGILLLMFEVIKGARPGAKFLTDHLLSLLVFGGAAFEFSQWPQFGTSTYFLLTLLALVDFLSGIALRARRRPVIGPDAPDIDDPHTGLEVPEPQFDPAPARSQPPASPVQAAASVAEAVLMDRPEPKFANPEPTLNGTSPRVLSPGLQPSPEAPTG